MFVATAALSGRGAAEAAAPTRKLISWTILVINRKTLLEKRKKYGIN